MHSILYNIIRGKSMPLYILKPFYSDNEERDRQSEPYGTVLLPLQITIDTDNCIEVTAFEC